MDRKLHCETVDSTKNPDSEAGFATTQIKQIAQIHQLPADCRGRLADTTMATCAPGPKSIGVAIALCQSLPLPQPAQSAYPLSPIIAVVFRRRLHVSLEVGCTNNAACEDGAKNHVAISQNVLPPPQVTLPRPLCAALHRLQHEQLSHRLPSSNKPGLTIFHQHFGNQRARVVVR